MALGFSGAATVEAEELETLLMRCRFDRIECFDQLGKDEARLA